MHFEMLMHLNCVQSNSYFPLSVRMIFWCVLLYPCIYIHLGADTKIHKILSAQWLDIITRLDMIDLFIHSYHNGQDTRTGPRQGYVNCDAKGELYIVWKMVT